LNRFDKVFNDGTFKEPEVIDVINFYRETVEPNRYSRTTDFTMKEIQGIAHDNPAKFHGRFHVKTMLGEKSIVNYGLFDHYQDPNFFGKYYLFSDVSQVQNPFAIQCSNGIEWFLNVQSQAKKINHELNGQAYDVGQLIEDIDSNTYLLFGTPSRKFNQLQQKEITEQIALSIKNDVYSLAIVYKEQEDHFAKMGLMIKPINEDLTLVGKDAELINKVMSFI
jgi:hypothetical protein